MLDSELAVVVFLVLAPDTSAKCISGPLAPFTHVANAETKTEVPNLHLKKLRAGR